MATTADKKQLSTPANIYFAHAKPETPIYLTQATNKTLHHID